MGDSEGRRDLGRKDRLALMFYQSEQRADTTLSSNSTLLLFFFKNYTFAFR